MWYNVLIYAYNIYELENSRGTFSQQYLFQIFKITFSFNNLRPWSIGLYSGLLTRRPRFNPLNRQRIFFLPFFVLLKLFSIITVFLQFLQFSKRFHSSKKSFKLKSVFLRLLVFLEVLDNLSYIVKAPVS